MCLDARASRRRARSRRRRCSSTRAPRRSRTRSRSPGTRPGGTAVIMFDRGFHGRTLLAMTLTSKPVYKRGMGPFAPEVYRAPAPYPYRGVEPRRPSTQLDCSSGTRSTPPGGVHDPRAGAGRGRVHVMPPSSSRACASVRPARYPVRRRRGPGGMGRTGRSGGSSTRRRSGPGHDGKSLAAGMPLAAVVGRAEVGGCGPSRRAGSTDGGNPVVCAAAVESSRRSPTPILGRLVEVGQRIQAPRALAERRAQVGQAAADGPMARTSWSPTAQRARGRGGGGDRGRCGARPEPAEERDLRQCVRILVPISATKGDLGDPHWTGSRRRCCCRG